MKFIVNVVITEAIQFLFYDLIEDISLGGGGGIGKISIILLLQKFVLYTPERAWSVACPQFIDRYRSWQE